MCIISIFFIDRKLKLLFISRYLINGLMNVGWGMYVCFNVLLSDFSFFLFFYVPTEMWFSKVELLSLHNLIMSRNILLSFHFNYQISQLSSYTFLMTFSHTFLKSPNKKSKCHLWFFYNTILQWVSSLFLFCLFCFNLLKENQSLWQHYGVNPGNKDIHSPQKTNCIQILP